MFYVSDVSYCYENTEEGTYSVNSYGRVISVLDAHILFRLFGRGKGGRRTDGTTAARQTS